MVLAVVVIHALLHSLNPKPLITTWRTGRDRLAMSGAVLAATPCPARSKTLRASRAQRVLAAAWLLGRL